MAAAPIEEADADNDVVEADDDADAELLPIPGVGGETGAGIGKEGAALPRTGIPPTASTPIPLWLGPTPEEVAEAE